MSHPHRYLLALLPWLAMTQANPSPYSPFDPERLSHGKSLSSLSHQGLDFFEPSQLKLVGILQQGDQRKALLQDPQQRVYPVTLDSLIGHHGWRVIRIGNKHITLSPPLATHTHKNREIHLSLESQP